MKSTSTQEANALAMPQERRAYWLAREKRDWRIIWFALLGMTGVYSLQNLAGSGVRWSSDLFDLLVTIAIAVCVGAFTAAYAGLALAFVAILCLRRRSLLMSGLIIFGPTTVLAIYLSTTTLIPLDYLSSVCMIFAAACLLAVVCRLLLPQRPFVRPSHLCPVCWYDLRAGLLSAGCPECGWGRGDSNEPLP